MTVIDKDVTSQGESSAIITGLTEGSYEIELTVTGGYFSSGIIRVSLIVEPPLDCSTAYPSTSILWPPNKEIIPVQVLGVTNFTAEPMVIEIDAIRQDERVGKGKFSPDGFGVGTSTAGLRAERKINGNGRVYHIRFTARVESGGFCSGEVLVGVPHDQDGGSVPIDDGPLFDSTQPG